MNDEGNEVPQDDFYNFRVASLITWEEGWGEEMISALDTVTVRHPWGVHIEKPSGQRSPDCRER